MGYIFALLGRAYSYKNFAFEYCSHNPALNCVNICNVNMITNNVVICSMADLLKLDEKYTGKVYPVYFDTSEYQVLTEGISYCGKNGKSYNDMCKQFIEETKEYESNKLVDANVTVIKADNVCDACYLLIGYMKSVLSGVLGRTYKVLEQK